MGTNLYAHSTGIKAIPISLDRTLVAYTDGNGNYYSAQNLENSYSPVMAYNGKAITEQNLTNLLKMFVGTDIKGFVVAEDWQESKLNSLEFMLDGYYFNLSDPNILDKKPLFASLSFWKSAIAFRQFLSFTSFASSM